ncbi:MAG: hypothetical protein C0594_01725, partial [Marinilabiliales bacterium]
IAGFSASNTCMGQKTIFTDTSLFAGGIINSWSWNFGDSDTSNLQNPFHTYNDEGDYTVTLSLGSAQGCNEAISQQITVHKVPEAGFNTNGNDMVAGEIIHFNDESENTDYWTWDFGDETDTDSIQEPDHIYNLAGTYLVKQIVANQYQCKDSLLQNILIQEDQVYGPVIPLAFTPNNDNENDILYVRGGPFETLTFIVFNKWGQEIFRTESELEGWDGTFKGKDQPPGVYVYIIEAKTLDGKSYTISDDVTLIR